MIFYELPIEEKEIYDRKIKKLTEEKTKTQEAFDKYKQRAEAQR